ncbi:EpsG family protein [Pedobacter chinensis]|uniref:EpsG family protein n=1 Tax=Pedobacter chinensis TaxID=2282421 RepID=A0A369PNU2_9SPHI|nr:EpsG family protein [Pedobacter chinensis]RDC54271.1 EpsG family protein [Pedobacter chinensis]
MTIYIILYGLLLFSVFFDTEGVSLKSKKEILIWWVIIFTLFRGLRWDTGTDWDQYLHVFQASRMDNIFNYARNGGAISMEPGYVFINAIVKVLGGNYTIFLLLTNLLVLWAYYKFSVTNSKTPIMVFVLIMFSTQFFPVRIGIAVGILMIGLFDLSKLNVKKGLFFTFLAFTVHSSSIIFAPVFVLGTRRFKPSTNLAVGVAIGFLILGETPLFKTFLTTISENIDFLGDDIAHKFDNYLDFDIVKKGAIIAVGGMINNVLFIILLFLFGKMIDKVLKISSYKESEIYFTFLFNTFFVFVMISIVFQGDAMAGLRRLQNYFMFAFPLLFSYFIYRNKKIYPYLSVFLTFGLIFYALFRSYSLFFGGYPAAHFPYKSIFDYAF